MRLSAWILSLSLHAAVILMVVFWPAPAPLKLDAPPIMISLVEGAPGGQAAPSPILGHVGEPGEGEIAPAAPAPQKETAAPERPEPAPEPEKAQAEPVPLKAPPIPEPKPEPKPAPVKIEEPKKQELPKPEPAPVKKAEAPKPEPKKEEKPKEQPKKPEPSKEAPKKPQQPKKPAPKPDPVATALAQARKASSRANSPEKGNAVEQALAQARKSASGTGGGGGGEGDGPGGGGILDVYIGQVMLAVKPNWGFASSARLSLACVVKVNVDMAGKVLDAVVSKSSGNAQFDASAVNAVVRTGQSGEFPPPPNPECADLELVFTLDEMRKR